MTIDKTDHTIMRTTIIEGLPCRTVNDGVVFDGKEKYIDNEC